MKDRAYAKINLALDVFNIRENGYHDIKSIMVPVNFYDELEINVADENQYICNKKYIRFDSDNSIIKTINVIQDRFNIKDKYYINLNKIIPIQAGLSGGTADAASVLRIFKKIYNLQLTKQEERDICVSVGADVLFNYYNTPAIVSGIGDVVEPIKIKKEYYVVIIKPRTGISTRNAYEKLDMKVCDHPDIDKLKCAFENGESIDGLLGNSLEQPAMILNPEIKKIKNMLIENGARNVLMTGSGSSVFAISEEPNETEKLAQIAKKYPYYVRLTKIKAN